MKLYIFANNKYLAPKGTEDIDGLYNLISEDGEILYGHYCSYKHYAKGDLIMNRPERQKECAELYGEYEVLYLGEDDMTLDELVKRFHEWESVHGKQKAHD